MDYLELPRELIYKERRSLEDFADENEELELIIDNMISNYYFSSADGKIRVLRCFNTAYYLCTLILLCDKHADWNFAKYCDIAYCNDNKNNVYQAFTLSLVYIFLTHTYYEVPCKKLIEKLNDFLSSRAHFLQIGDPFLNDYFYSDVCNDLQKNLPEDWLFSEEFKPRKIDNDIYHDVDKHNSAWYRLTEYYRRKVVIKIVQSLGKDASEKKILVDLIRRDAERFYGSDSVVYTDQVKPLLEEIDKSISHEYNASATQTIQEAEIEEFKYQGDVRPLKAKIAELEKEIAYLKEQLPDDSLQQQLADAQKTIEELNLAVQSYKGQGKGLSAPEAAIFLTAICLELNQIPSNGREGLAPIIEYCWGKSNSTAAEALRRKVTEQSANKLACFFEDKAPKLARLIRELPQKLEKIKNEHLLKINPNC